MRFEMLHEFPLSVASLERAIFHPDLLGRLVVALDRVEEMKEVERRETEEAIERRVRVRPRFDVPSFAKGRIKPEMTEYDEVSRYDRRAHRFTYTIEPNIPRAWHDKFVSRGSYSLVEQPGPRTRRRIEVELVLKIPLIGGLAERYIAENVKANFDQEAKALGLFARELEGA